MVIVKNGLVAYWNYKQGVINGNWNNIAPSTLGKHNMILGGATLRTQGVYFDGVDDTAETSDSSYNISSEITIESICVVHNFVIATFIKGLLLLSAIANEMDGNEMYALTSWIDYTAIIPNLRAGFYFSGVGDGIPLTAPYIIPLNTTLHVQCTLNTTTGLVRVFVNGALIGSTSTNIKPSTGNKLATGYLDGLGAEMTLQSTRVYNRILSDSELAQNYQNGSEIGLSDTPVSNPPTVTLIQINKQKISDETDNNQSIITVQFDKNVTEYVARLNGTDYSTGILVHQGGEIPANTNAQVIIDWNELTTEGQSRINVYGKSVEGLWTPYSLNN